MADVGQVQFQVLADGLDVTLKKAEQLQAVLNGIDGKAIVAGGRSAMNVATKQLSAEQKAARIYHAQSEKRIKDQMRIHKIDARNHDWAMKKEKELATARSKFAKEYTRNMVNWGAQMQSLGNALQRISSPFQNVFRGLTMGIGYRLLGKITQSISGAFERYDTMKTYDKVLKQIGLDADKKFAVGANKAQSAIENLNDAVLGLPTGLDEIVGAMRKYAGATGDVERATKLAIAANNAYIAGAMDSRQQLFTERQLLSLAGGAELSSNQWDSLRRNAPLAVRSVAKAMKMGVQDMIESLKKGKISGQEFLDMFIKVGTEGKISKAAQVMKVTWDSVSQNFQNAMNRMGASILETLDDVFKEMDGRTFLQHALGVDKNGKYIGGGIRGVIDDLSKSAQDWIRANPTAITDFFNTISKINWTSIASGFAQFAMTMGKFYGWLAKMTNGNAIRALLDLGLLGKGLTIGGGLLKGSAGIMGWLASLAKFSGIGKAVGTAKSLSQNKDALVGAAGTMQGMALSWQSVAVGAISVAAIPAMAWALKEVAIALQEFDKVDISWGSLVGKLGQASVAIGYFATMAGALGAVMSSTPIGWAGALIEGAGVAMITAIAGALIAVAKGLNDIATVQVPDTAKIQQVVDAIDQVGVAFTAKNPFEAIGKIFDAWTKGAEFDAIAKVSEAFNSLKKLGKIKIPEDVLTSAKQNFATLSDFVNQVESMVNGQEIPGITYGTGYRRNTIVKSNWSISIDEFTRKISSIATAFTSMQSAINQIKSLKKVKPESIDTEAIASLAEKLDEAIKSLEEVGSRTVDMSLTIEGEIKDEFKSLLDKEYKEIKAAIDQFDKLPKSKTITLTLSAHILGMQAVVQTAKDAVAGVRAAIANINGTINKTITVNTMRKSIQQHNGGKVQYRAHGGSIFNSRGTDTVPAMLTPGEYVMNRMAASRVGDETLWRLNHMDLAGALRSLSARVGQSIIPRGNVINNTTNNTRNNNVSIHNSASAGVGLGRANRWVMSL